MKRQPLRINTKTDERTGEQHDYRQRDDLDRAEILTPRGSPEWAQDRARLWNAVETAERRKDAQVAREIRVAIPRERRPERRPRARARLRVARLCGPWQDRGYRALTDLAEVLPAWQEQHPGLDGVKTVEALRKIYGQPAGNGSAGHAAPFRAWGWHRQRAPQGAHRPPQEPHRPPDAFFGPLPGQGSTPRAPPASREGAPGYRTEPEAGGGRGRDCGRAGWEALPGGHPSAGRPVYSGDGGGIMRHPGEDTLTKHSVRSSDVRNTTGASYRCRMFVT